MMWCGCGGDGGVGFAINVVFCGLRSVIAARDSQLIK